MEEHVHRNDIVQRRKDDHLSIRVEYIWWWWCRNWINSSASLLFLIPVFFFFLQREEDENDVKTYARRTQSTIITRTKAVHRTIKSPCQIFEAFIWLSFLEQSEPIESSLGSSILSSRFLSFSFSLPIRRELATFSLSTLLTKLYTLIFSLETLVNRKRWLTGRCESTLTKHGLDWLSLFQLRTWTCVDHDEAKQEFDLLAFSLF